MPVSPVPVSVTADKPPIRAIVTDIEGTTSSLSFVKDVLFPYARARMETFVAERGSEPGVRELLDEVAAIAGRRLDERETVAQLRTWIDEDRKITPLKALQGLIWEQGYRRGDLTGHFYEDAVRRLRDWRRDGLSLFVFSSGSVHAQQLLFGHAGAGDLTPLISGWFDTRVGAKGERESYRRIAAETGFAPEAMLFLSDIPAELDAAAAAGMRTVQLCREGEAQAPGAHDTAGSFDEVQP